MPTDPRSTINALLADNTAAEITAADMRNAFDAALDYVEAFAAGANVYTLTGTALDPTNGAIQEKTLAAPATLTDSLADGQVMLLHILNGATHAVTWPTGTWVGSDGDTAPAMTADDTIGFWKIGSTLYMRYAGNSI